MYKLFVSKKTGFRNKTPYNPVNIRDFRGVIFYTTEGLTPVYEFNLPEGEYMVDSGVFTPMETPVKYRLVKLPTPERWYPNPFKYDIVFGANPNKCSIFWDEKTILFDKKLLESPLYVLDFILFHEYSHQRYGTEKYADLMSGNYMKKCGYNPSQIAYAPIDSLSESADPRKELMVKKIIQYR